MLFVGAPSGGPESCGAEKYEKFRDVTLRSERSLRRQMQINVFERLQLRCNGRPILPFSGGRGVRRGQIHSRAVGRRRDGAPVVARAPAGGAAWPGDVMREAVRIGR